MVDLQTLLEFVKRAGTAPPAPQDSPGNQAMAAAAQMAAPSGVSMPKPPAPAQQPPPEDGSAQQELAAKDQQISELREQLNEEKLNTEKERMRSEIQAERQRAEASLRKEQEALARKQTEYAASEERHRANMEKETARQQAQVAKSEADATVRIAQRDADSIKATADSNARDYVKMTEAARKDVDAYRAQQQAAFDKQVQESKKSNPYIPVSLQNQLDGALAATKNVAKLRARLAKTASASSQPQPAQPSQPQPVPQPAPAAAPVSPNPQPKQTPAAPQATAEQRAAARATQSRLRAMNEQANAHNKLVRIGDKVSLQGDLTHRHKEQLMAEQKLDYLRRNNADLGTIREWQEAVDTSKAAQQKYMQELKDRAAGGDAAAKEELAQYTDFTQMRGVFGGTNSEAADFSEAARYGLTPEEYQAFRDADDNWVESAGKWLVQPIADAGQAISDAHRSSQLAANRGLSMQWFDSDYKGAAGDAYEEALRQRNLNGTVLGNAGNIGLNAGLAALDTAGNFALASGLFSGAGASLKAMSAAARGVRAANAAYRAGQPTMRAAMKGMQRGYKQYDPGNIPGFGRAYNVAKNYGKSTLGRIDDIGLAPLAGSLAAGIGQASGTDALNWMDVYGARDAMKAQQHTPSGAFMAADGTVRDSGGNTLGHYDGVDLDYYKQSNPEYVQQFSSPQVKSASWNTDFAQMQMQKTPYNSTMTGKLLQFASPHVSSFTGGKVNLAPITILPSMDLLARNMQLGKIDALTSMQTKNPLFNREANKRGMVDDIVDMRKQVVAHPLNQLAQMSAGPSYHQYI